MERASVPISNTSALKPHDPDIPFELHVLVLMSLPREPLTVKSSLHTMASLGVLRSCPPSHGDQENPFIK